MSLLVLAAAAGFACAAPTHHDGDAIRCAGMGRSMRLQGIDAPEMPGACRPGRACTPGDPYAARDYLASLTRGRAVVCEQVDTDHYGRRIVRCTADGRDLACAMIAAGQAVARYGDPGCGSAATASRRPEAAPLSPPPVDTAAAPAAVRAPPPVKRYFAPEDAPPVASPTSIATTGIALWAAFAGWLIAINILGWAAMADDKARAQRGWRNGERRIPEAALLGIAAFGGSVGVLAAGQRLRHKTNKPAFATGLNGIMFAQLVLVAGLIALF